MTAKKKSGGYVANTQIKVGSFKTDDDEGEHYIQVGEDVSEGDFSEKDWDDLVQAQAVVTQEVFDILHQGTNEGANQPAGTPSNLEQIEGTDLQMNPPEDQLDPEAAPPVRDAPPNPANVIPVEGAPTPGDGSDSAGQDSASSEDES
jgi:hypothetical protein